MVGDDTPVIDAVLACDVERLTLLAEEADILKRLNIERREDPTSAANGGVASVSVEEEGETLLSIVTCSAFNLFRASYQHLRLPFFKCFEP